MSQDFLQNTGAPLHWLQQLPDPKNAATVLQELEKIPSEEILSILGICPEEDCSEEAYLKILKKGSWDEDDLAELSSFADDKKKVS